jgi:hypothetical protein
MRTIRDAGPSNLSWQQPQAFKCEYELRAGDELLGSIHKTRKFGVAMEAEIGGTRFMLETVGFTRSRIMVREAGAAGEPAVFQRGFFGGGQLLLPGGRSYRWKMTSFWGSRWAFVDDSGQPLVSLRPRKRVFRTGGEVEIAPGALTLPELPMLVLLGWYLLLRTLQDSASAAGAAAAAAGA